MGTRCIYSSILNCEAICQSVFCFLPDVYSLEWDQFHWTEIGDEGTTALADLRVFKNFKTLK